MPRRVAAVSRFARQTGQLVALAWQAQPASFSGLLVLNVTQGLVPVATAWVTKLLFDLLASAQHPWVLRHVNLTIPANRCTALVGSNGAGKTTLVKLLTRLYDPTEGHILWDGTDLRDFAPEELRARIGAIFQDYAQYSLTARENIGVGDVRRLADLGRVRQAAMSAGIHEALVALQAARYT